MLRNLLTITVVASGLAGCGAHEKTTTGPGDGTGVKVSIEALGVTADVTTVKFTLDRQECATEATNPDDEPFAAMHQVVDVKVSDLNLPESVPAGSGAPSHFADAFFTLTPGCYALTAAPQKGDGASIMCKEASIKDIRVNARKTTEVFLTSQCKGRSRGALDTTLVFNRPPEINTFTYQPSKYVACGQEVRLCAQATDQDGDLIDFRWAQTGGPEAKLTFQIDPITDVASTEATNPNPEEVVKMGCARLTVATPGRYTLSVAALDLTKDENGHQITFEDFLAHRGQALESRDLLEVPLYVSCTQEGTGGAGGNAGSGGNAGGGGNAGSGGNAGASGGGGSGGSAGHGKCDTQHQS